MFPLRQDTALILRNEYVHLFEGAFRNLIYARSHLTPQNFQEICACFLAHIKSQIWDASTSPHKRQLPDDTCCGTCSMNLAFPMKQLLHTLPRKCGVREKLFQTPVVALPMIGRTKDRHRRHDRQAKQLSIDR